MRCIKSFEKQVQQARGEMGLGRIDTRGSVSANMLLRYDVPYAAESKAICGLQEWSNT